VKTYVGIDLGEWLRITIISPTRGIIAHSKHELPGASEARSEKMMEVLTHALENLSARLPPCEGVGIAFSPPETEPRGIILPSNTIHPSLPYISGAPVLFSGPEVSALLPFFAPTPKRAWVIFGGRARIYYEEPESNATIRVIDEQNKTRFFAYKACPWIMEPIRVLLDRLGLFDSLSDVEQHAGIIEDSAGVIFAPQYSDNEYKGITISELKPGTRRPQIARAAMESVGAWIRYTVAEMAGEGTVTELYAAGSDSSSDFLMRVISDVTGFTLERAEVRNAVACGAALRAAKLNGESIAIPEAKRFVPKRSISWRDQIYARWISASKL